MEGGHDLVKMGGKFNDSSFPRKDNYFRTKSSLGFQEIYSRIWQTRDKGSFEHTQEVLCFILLGFFVGFTGFVMDILEMLLVYVKDAVTQNLID